MTVNEKKKRILLKSLSLFPEFTQLQQALCLRVSFLLVKVVGVSSFAQGNLALSRA